VRIALEAMLDGVAIYSSVRGPSGEIVDFRCEFANEAVAANGGPGPEEQVGRTMRETFPGIVESGHFAMHVRVVETGEPAVADVTWYEDAGARGWFEVHSVRLDDGCLVAFRNVTHQREQEAALRSSEERLDRFLQALPVGVAVVDQTGPVFMNRAGEALLGRGVDADVPIRDLTKHYSLVRLGTDEPYPIEAMPLRRALRDGETVEATDVAVRRPDRDLPIDSFATPIRDASGDVVAAISVFRDATERREREGRLEAALADLAQANADLSDFAAHAAHDLAEPLRAITGFTDLIRRRYGAGLDAEALDWLDLMLDGTARMRLLIEDLVAYVKAGTAPFDATVVDLATVLATARQAIDGPLAERGGVVEVAELPVVNGDAAQLVRLFQNLLANAVKYARPGVAPKVTVAATRSGDGWEITVTDNGRGIPEADRERVFGPFQRAGSETEPGSGLGLAICRRIAERHGGDLRLTSSTGMGARFCLTLPAT